MHVRNKVCLCEAVDGVHVKIPSNETRRPSRDDGSTFSSSSRVTPRHRVPVESFQPPLGTFGLMRMQSALGLPRTRQRDNSGLMGSSWRRNRSFPSGLFALTEQLTLFEVKSMKTRTGRRLRRDRLTRAHMTCSSLTMRPL